MRLKAPRVPPVEPENWTDEQREIFGDLRVNGSVRKDVVAVGGDAGVEGSYRFLTTGDTATFRETARHGGFRVKSAGNAPTNRPP